LNYVPEFGAGSERALPGKFLRSPRRVR